MELQRNTDKTDFEKADFVADSPGGFSSLVEKPELAMAALKRAAELLVPCRVIEPKVVSATEG